MMVFCRAMGVSHSLGMARSMKGMQEDMYARRFTQLGSSLPHKICKNTPCVTEGEQTVFHNRIN
jgi:hypothetical protein